MKPYRSAIFALLAAASVAVCGAALAQQDRSALRVPDGLAFSEFKGYEAWENVAVSQTDKQLKVIAGNPAMIQAYRSGLPPAGKPVPDGSKLLKLEWSRKLDPNAPTPVYVPDQLQAVEFMVKDSKRFPDTHGWGYAFFANDPATNTLKPVGTGSACGNACHTKVSDRDYVYTSYPAR